MNKIISAENLLFVQEAIKYISEKLGFNNYQQALWMAFGSYVINRNRPGSDLDIIAIDDFFTEGKRSVLNFQNVPIHFTGINMGQLKDDGESRLYGSYFSGKVINPHIFLYGDKKLKQTALFQAGKFIAPLAGYLATRLKTKHLTSSQITSLVFIAYLCTDPSFDSYFLNYFISPQFKEIWAALCKSTINMLSVAGSIDHINGKYYFKEKFPDYKTFHCERMKISARHWSYGAVCHGSDYKFQDLIFSNAVDKMQRIDPLNNKYPDMVRFLQETSGLPEIYI